MKTKFFFVLILITAFVACKKSPAIEPVKDTRRFESKLTVGDHELTYYYSKTNSDKLVVFESGLGDGASPWTEKNILTEMVKSADVLYYDRAGYGKSTSGSEPRTIARTSDELGKVIDAVANGRKVILAGHSIGGLIIRDYAIKNPAKTAGLLFVDPSHEQYNLTIINQALADSVYKDVLQAYGPAYGATMEVAVLIKNFEYCATLPHLPNVPVTVLTSMQTGVDQSEQNRQSLYNAHELLKDGVNDFVHIGTTASGHYIQRDQPELVIQELKKLLQKAH